MKNVDIKKKAYLEYKKDIYLGNGVKLVFTSKRTATYFVGETNRFLTKCLVILNSTYTDTFYQYRSAWLTTTNMKFGTATNALQTERKAKEFLQSTSDVLDKFCMTEYGSNDPVFSFLDLMKAALLCKDAAQILHDYFKRRNLTNNAYECQMLADRCESVHTNLKVYGKDKKSEKPPPPIQNQSSKPKRRPRPYTMENKPTETTTTETK